jgi:hypothetical protein
VDFEEVGNKCLSCRHRRCRWKCWSVEVEQRDELEHGRKKLKKKWYQSSIYFNKNHTKYMREPQIKYGENKERIGEAIR